jgi:hypothetical protein
LIRHTKLDVDPEPVETELREVSERQEDLMKKGLNDKYTMARPTITIYTSIGFRLVKNLLPCVSGIVTFLNNEIEPHFFPFLLLCLNHLLLEFNKNLRPKPFAGMRPHTNADKLNCFIHKRIIISFTIYYSYEGHDPWHTLYLLIDIFI